MYFFVLFIQLYLKIKSGLVSNTIFAKINELMNIRSVKTEDYSYILSEKMIAKYPLPNRDNSKLLVYNKGEISHRKFNELSDLLPENSLIVFNNTKVIQSRLIFYKPTGARIEIFCLEPVSPPDYAMVFQETDKCTWKCIVGNLKKWKNDTISAEIYVNDHQLKIEARKVERNSESQHIEFTWNNNEVLFGEILKTMGQTPIPPYLKRNSEDSDKINYQTVYSKHNGSVAAPTAGLHFTIETLESLKKKSVKLDNVTLHIGAGTFKPVKSQMIGDHEMHTEHFSVNLKLINNLINNTGQLTATGTTTVRTLESLYWLGVKIKKNQNLNNHHINQWETYDLPGNISVKDSLRSISDYMVSNQKETINASTQIIIVPGYKFKLINKLITNFHQPKSTLLLLVAAFIGDDFSKIYDYALNNDFRFLSYGDSSILIPK